MKEMSKLAEERADIAWIAVSHAPLEATDRWCADVGASHLVRLVIDEERSAYGAWGLGRTSLRHFAGRRSIAAAVRLARKGIRNRHPVGSRWQHAGTFAVDSSGNVAWRQVPRHAGDLPDLAAAAEAALS